MQKIQLNDRQRFLRFAVVGVSGTVVDFSIFFLLSRIFNFPKNESYSISFIIAVVNNFIWNRKWTYPESKEKNVTEQLIKFSIVSVVGFFIRKIVFPLLNKPLIDYSKLLFGQQFFIKPEAIGDFLALSFVIIVVLFWNYFINRIWTYKGIT